MKINQIKFFAIAILALMMFVILAYNSNSVRAVRLDGDDVAADFKTKCAACHSPKAEKFYDTAKTDEQHIEIILKGKKGEKPPYMPGFEAKGMTAEQAKALAEYMKQLRCPTPTPCN